MRERLSAWLRRRPALAGRLPARSVDLSRIDSLEEAVAENARLAVPLEQQVARLEAALEPLLRAVEERRTR